MIDVMKSTEQSEASLNLRAMAEFLKLWWVLLALLLPATAFAQNPLSETPKEDADKLLSQRESISCLSYCSAIESRTNLTDISFGGLPVDAKNAELEFTVYNDGFEREAFAIFSPLVADAEVEPRVSLPALRGLRPFSLRLVEMQLASREPRIHGVTLKGMEPNVDYLWRIRYQSEKGWMSSNIARCPTPVCIHDAQR